MEERYHEENEHPASRFYQYDGRHCVHYICIFTDFHSYGDREHTAAHGICGKAKPAHPMGESIALSAHLNPTRMEQVICLSIIPRVPVSS